MIRDMIFYTIIGFVVALVFLVAYIGYALMNAEFQTLDGLSTEQKAEFQGFETSMPSAWDYSFLFIIIAFTIGILIISWMLQSSPIMFVVFWFISMITSIIAGHLSNAFSDILLDTTMGNAATHFPITVFIMNNYLVYVMVLGFLMIFVFFAKPSVGGEYGY